MKISVGSGIDNYINALEELSKATNSQIGKAVYAGADIVADAIRQNIKNLPVDNSPSYSAKEKLQGLKKLQKIGLLHSFGISKSRNDNGYINVKAGFDGYNLIKTKAYPGGQPNAMIARTIENGNSFTHKHPFVRPAVNATRQEAEKRMAEVIDSEISKIMK